MSPPLPRHAAGHAAMAAVLTGLCALPPAQADTGKLLLTSGVSSIDGAAGGGLSPWALTGTYATERQTGFSAYATRALSQDYALNSHGLAFGMNDRLEITLAQQRFDTGPTGVALGLPGLALRQDILGVKYRVAGEAILDSDNALPQIALGLLHKRSDAGGLRPTLAAAGAKAHGTDLYAAFSKLFLAQGILVNGTLRWTEANQNGLLGFGSQRRSRPQLMPELSVAWLPHRHLAIGVEYRKKPDNLNHILGPGVLQEDDWKDIFVAWAPSKHLSLTAAYVALGRVAPPFVTRKQHAFYLSLQAAY